MKFYEVDVRVIKPLT